MVVFDYGGFCFRAYAWMLGKRLFLFVPLVLIGLASCDTAFGINLQNYGSRSEELESAWKRTASYRYIDDSIGYWKSPREFENDGGGDCEDFATYLIYLLGDKSSMYVVTMNGRKIEHALVYYGGILIEPQIYMKTYSLDDFDLDFTLTYNETMWRTTLFGIKKMVPDIPDTPGASDAPISF